MGERCNGFATGTITYETQETNPVDFARRLIESVRLSADVDYGTSQSCVELVVSQLCKELNLVQLTPVMKALNEDIIDICSCNDSHRLRKCLTELSSFKADGQQRTWSIHEDAGLILDSLAVLLDLLKKADPRVSIYALSEDEYARVYDLVEFYQMETRSIIRIALLEAFMSILSFQPSHVSILLTTVLPVEIAQDIINDGNRVPKKFHLSLQVLTLLLSTGEQIPLPYYDVLNEHFVSKLLTVIEDENQPADISKAATACLVAFNLHFREDNLVTLALRNRADSGTKLTETLLLLVNKKVDPVWPFKAVECPYAFSVLKVLETLFADDVTAKLFYTNDVTVLVEIVLRELLDLLPSKMRTEYLALLHVLTTKTQLSRSNDRLREEILDVILRLEQNASEDGSSERDKEYFQEIKQQLTEVII